jgi:tRNA threonylcarbamoyladenosine biosynthesis protein TsaB
MRLLAIDTSSEACSAALYLDGEVRLRWELAPRRHAERIIPMMDALLTEAGLRLADLDGLAFGRGPGAFTGVRIATGVVQGAAFGAGLPVVPVSTLAALAQRAVRECGADRVLPALDARMDEVYWAGYRCGEDGLVEPVLAEELAPAGLVTLPEEGRWWGVGSGWSAYGAILGERLAGRIDGIDGELLCSAQDVALLGARGLARGEGVPAEQALPVYLRDRVASKPAGR